MNYRSVIATGLVTATIGATLGWGMGQIALRHSPSQLRTSLSDNYQNLYNRQFIWLGAIAGGLIGMGQNAVMQLKTQEDKQREKDNSQS
jgi:hypothetical protein